MPDILVCLANYGVEVPMNAEKSPVNHNVDHEEIAKFEAVASRWWDLEGEVQTAAPH
ncbi:hypothetical protein GCM10029976_003020 [Kribbella albertanoniae]